MKMMKQSFVNRVFLSSGCLALALGLGAQPAVADGNETLGVPQIAIASGSGTVTEGVSLKESGAGTIPLNVPDGARIKQVLLYWGSRRLSNQGAGENLMRVDGVQVTGTSIGGPAPVPASGEPLANYAYRADITQHGFVNPGMNSLQVQSLQATPRVTEGAAIVVIYDDRGIVSYRGGAFGLKARIGPNTTTVVNTGELPASGGVLAPNPINDTNIGGLVKAKTVSARTVGADGKTRSEAAVEGASITAVPGVPITAAVINSAAAANCTADGATVSGHSTFANLKVGTLVNLPVVFPPNTVLLNLGVIKVVANEQIRTGAGNQRGITVNGLHVTSPLPGALLGGPTDITVASSRAEVNCATSVSPANIQIRDGSDFAFGNFSGDAKETKLQTFTFPASPFERKYKADFFVTDGDPLRPDVTEFYLNGGPHFSVNDQVDGSDGLDADVDTYADIPVHAGFTSVGLRVLSKFGEGSTLFTNQFNPDSLAWTFAVFTMENPLVAAPFAYSGRATVLRAELAGLTSTAAADTGELPGSGGELRDDANNLLISPVLGSVTGTASTIGAGNRTDSTARVEKLNLAILGTGITADLISSKAAAVCSGGSASASGASDIVNLRINGVPVAPGSPAIPLPLPGGLIHINERVVSGSGKNASIRVNAIRINVPNPLPGHSDLVNVVVSSSKAGIVCN